MREHELSGNLLFVCHAVVAVRNKPVVDGEELTTIEYDDPCIFISRRDRYLFVVAIDGIGFVLDDYVKETL